MACFVAAYRAPKGAGTKPRTELMLMIRPLPCSRICGSTARVIRIEPKTFVSNRARVCSIELSSAAPAMPRPALLTSTSMRPERPSTSRTPLATDTSSVTSSGRNVTASRSSPATALLLVPHPVDPASTSCPAAPLFPPTRPAARPVHGDPGLAQRSRGRLTDPGRCSRHQRYPSCLNRHDLSFARLYITGIIPSYDRNTVLRDTRRQQRLTAVPREVRDALQQGPQAGDAAANPR